MQADVLKVARLIPQIFLRSRKKCHGHLFSEFVELLYILSMAFSV
jgi:hypothetical protein